MLSRIFFALCVSAGLFCGVGSQAHAKPEQQRAITATDFAIGRSIEVSGASPVYSFEVPEDVYRVTTRSDLGDTRIFSKAGAAVPHEVSRIAPTSQESIVTAAIPFFPIEGASSSRNGYEGVEVTKDAAGKMLRVWFADQASGAGEARTAYLFDLREFKRRLISLTVQASDLAANKIVDIQIDGSDDLKSWRSIQTAGVLAKITYLDQEIKQDKITFPTATAKFLRLSFPGGDKVTLTGVAGEFLSSEQKTPIEHWLNLSTNVEPELPTTFFFDSKGYFPQRSFRLTLPQINTFVRVRLSSRPHAEAQWSLRYSGSVYRLTTKDGELSSPAQSLNSPTSDPIWRLEIEGRDSQLGSGTPQLHLGWVPDEILFMAQGEAPFRFVYGSGRAKSADFGFANLSAVSKGQGMSAELATLGAPEEIGGSASRIVPPPPTPDLWKKWILWIILVGFIIVVGIMTLRLAKDLKKS